MNNSQTPTPSAALAVLKGLHQSNTDDREALRFILGALDEANDVLHFTARRYPSTGLSQSLEGVQKILNTARAKASAMNVDAGQNLQFLETLIDERHRAQGKK